MEDHQRDADSFSLGGSAAREEEKKETLSSLLTGGEFSSDVEVSEEKLKWLETIFSAFLAFGLLGIIAGVVVWQICAVNSLSEFMKDELMRADPSYAPDLIEKVFDKASSLPKNRVR